MTLLTLLSPQGAPPVIDGARRWLASALPTFRDTFAAAVLDFSTAGIARSFSVSGLSRGYEAVGNARDYAAEASDNAFASQD